MEQKNHQPTVKPPLNQPVLNYFPKIINAVDLENQRHHHQVIVARVKL